MSRMQPPLTPFWKVNSEAGVSAGEELTTTIPRRVYLDLGGQFQDLMKSNHLLVNPANRSDLIL